MAIDKVNAYYNIITKYPNVLGARMMGGGFGGCTINLVKTEAVDGLIARISERYKDDTGTEMLVYEVGIESGTCLMSIHD